MSTPNPPTPDLSSQMVTALEEKDIRDIKRAQSASFLDHLKSILPEGAGLFSFLGALLGAAIRELFINREKEKSEPNPDKNGSDRQLITAGSPLAGPSDACGAITAGSPLAGPSDACGAITAGSPLGEPSRSAYGTLPRGVPEVPPTHQAPIKGIGSSQSGSTATAYAEDGEAPSPRATAANKTATFDSAGQQANQRRSLFAGKLKTAPSLGG